ncbi:electron transport complex protein RnfG [Clostridium pascui]|uniref:RnfABCDGE type electron transport complex subunit G n=1 Tax=Clostridium pascui TaxID=46609 RepID=UPI001957187A|nr:RnfABCDGE type electron transport complex subunit G [Clostridium pascui]MBM7871059.1 electron transport complex protein RnfG [Clostridium pascui]
MKKNSSLKLGLVLLAIAAICGLILGGISEVTKEPIAVQAKKAVDEANKAILPEATEFVDKTGVEFTGTVSAVTEGKSGADVKGYTITVSPKGYAGAVKTMVGITTDGKVSGIKILEHAETPGLGALAPEPKFSGQFSGKPAKELTVVKAAPSADNQIEAITGATITSRAVTDGVNEAIKFFDANLKGGN